VLMRLRPRILMNKPDRGQDAPLQGLIEIDNPLIA